jgi:hypothetical protein
MQLLFVDYHGILITIKKMEKQDCSVFVTCRICQAFSLRTLLESHQPFGSPSQLSAGQVSPGRMWLLMICNKADLLLFVLCLGGFFPRGNMIFTVCMKRLYLPLFLEGDLGVATCNTTHHRPGCLVSMCALVWSLFRRGFLFVEAERGETRVRLSSISHVRDNIYQWFS